MNQPQLFALVKLLVDIPQEKLQAGVQGTIVECYSDLAYEVEFSNSEEETIALCPLPPEQFIVVWQPKTKTWL